MNNPYAYAKNKLCCVIRPPDPCLHVEPSEDVIVKCCPPIKHVVASSICYLEVTNEHYLNSNLRCISRYRKFFFSLCVTNIFSKVLLRQDFVKYSFKMSF